MKTINDVSTPFTDPIVPPPSPSGGSNVASTVTENLGEGSAPASPLKEGMTIAQRYVPKEGEPVPSKLEGTVASRTSGFGRVPTT